MTTFTASAPGKVMIAGEYCVLDGHRSLSFAVDQRLKAVAEVRTDGQFSIRSNLWDQELIASDLAHLPDQILTKICRWAQKHWQLPPFQLAITSAINVADGLGSSSALHLAVLKALSCLAEDEGGHDLALAQQAWQMQLQEQGFASGYDFATQITGGLVEYRNLKGDWSIARHEWQHLGSTLHLFRGGKGAPTKTVGGSTRQWLSDKNLMAELVDVSESLIDLFIGYNELDANYLDLIREIRRHRNLFSQNPNFPTLVFEKLVNLDGFDRDWTVKTTGAGGEDSLLLIHRGPIPTAIHGALNGLGWTELPFHVDQAGLVEGDTGDLH